MRRINPLSRMAVPIQLFCCNERIQTATGFFWSANGSVFLVSNWHVFSGRNRLSGQPLHRDGAVPDSFVIRWLHGSQSFVEKEIGFNLLDNCGTPKFLQHSQHGQAVDVAVVPLPHDFVSNQADLPICNRFAQMPFLAVDIGTEVYALGFPGDSYYTGTLPIWKRASVASEYNIQVDALDCFLIDTATRRGMSGAPVFALFRGGIPFGGGIVQTGERQDSEFLGIYSSRVDDPLNEFHLGRVWKRTIIEEVITDPAPASYDLKPLY